MNETSPINFARAMPNWQPLVEYRRNGVAENTIHGAVSWVSGRNVIYSFGGNVEVYGRSMVKPIMMKVFTREFARALTGEQKAISVASHNGDTEHVRVSRSILLQGEWGLMQAPLDVPLVQFGRQVRRPRRWYHCCSGEHAAILRGCKLKGWSRVGYVWPHHEFFQEYVGYVRHVLGSDWKQGTIAKEGAGGLLGLAIEHPEYPQGLGVVVKIAHGWNPQATWYIARYILGVLGFEFRNPYKLRRQKAFIVPEVIPPGLRDRMAAIVPWDSWDPDIDKWEFEPSEFIAALSS